LVGSPSEVDVGSTALVGSPSEVDVGSTAAAMVGGGVAAGAVAAGAWPQPTGSKVNRTNKRDRMPVRKALQYMVYLLIRISDRF
jgi:hypothetical protein